MIPSVSLSLHHSLLPLPSCNLIRNPNPSFPSSPARVRSLRRFICRRRRGGWDPNAESVRTGRFSFRDEGGEEEEEEGRGSRMGRSGVGWRWWSDESDDEFYDDFGDEDYGEDFWDKVWIFKVFKSYGYMLPAIIASMLLATGPKAFLLALALPLGQSAISLAVDKLWGRTAEEPRMRAKSKRKPFGRTSGNFRNQEKEGRKSEHRERNGYPYRAWVSADPKVADGVNASRKSGFGGWDDLNNQKGSMRKSPSTDGFSQAGPLEKGKLSKGGRYRDVPLFLRLLIAVFPFLGSWTRIL